MALENDAVGWSLFLWEGEPRYHYNFFGIRRYDVMGPDALKPGKYTISFAFVPDDTRPGVSANVTLEVNGVNAGSARMDEQNPLRWGTETMDMGVDCVSPVCEDYGRLGLFTEVFELRSH